MESHTVFHTVRETSRSVTVDQSTSQPSRFNPNPVNYVISQAMEFTVCWAVSLAVLMCPIPTPAVSPDLADAAFEWTFTMFYSNPIQCFYQKRKPNTPEMELQ